MGVYPVSREPQLKAAGFILPHPPMSACGEAMKLFGRESCECVVRYTDHTFFAPGGGD